MKALSGCLKNGWLPVLFFLVMACPAKISAQTIGSDALPTVTIQATEPVASAIQPENSNPFPLAKLGLFTVFRSGNTNETLNVFYQIGGTASNGVDYAAISNRVTIPAGAVSSSIVIMPINPSQTNTQTVVLQIVPPPAAVVSYRIGAPGRATVYIESTNLPPFPPVSIYGPTNGAVFYTPTNIQIAASISYLTPTNFGAFTNLEFFADDNDLGKGILEISSGFSGILFLTWTNPPPGNYALRAVASYSGNVSITSAPVNITVSLPVTNFPPVVRIISPANGAVFRAPINLPLFAFFTYPHEPFEFGSVGFYDGTNFLGPGQPVSTPTPLPLTPGGPTPVPPTVLSTNIYELVWSNAPTGSHILTAQATVGNLLNNAILRIVSAPVNITILPPLPPPTNRPAVVSIVATDPVAVAGTNSWTWPGETNSPPSWSVWPSAVSRFFTNAGPKTATFTIRRAGDTNDDLIVLYDIGGTASNGVDYVALPGFVTVPAGDRSALITVVPVDNGSNRISSAVKTVVLTLTPSTNAPPDYVLGFPRRAAAVIVDSHRPRPVTGMLPGGSFHLNAAGPDAAWFRVEYSTNLLNWTPVCTNQVVNGSINFIDPDAAGNSSRFYRAIPVTNMPAN